MRSKQFLWVAVVAASALSIAAITQIDRVSAQESGEAGVAGGGGFGSGGGGGGFGGGGGSGGGSGFMRSSGNGALTAYGEFVYVLAHGNLYQYAAYDLALVKKFDLSGNGDNNRIRRGGAGGGGGPGGEGEGSPGGAGGAGGAGGGFGGGLGRAEDVAAYGDFVYVLQGKTLRKLYANGLKPAKMVTLEFDVRAGK